MNYKATNANNKTTEIYNEKPRFGDVWMVMLDSGNGSVQSGYRPAWIVSNDMNNTHSPTVNIIPITSKAKKTLPIHVTVDCTAENGLTSQSTLLVEQIMTVRASALQKKIGRIADGDTLRRISAAMSIQFPALGLAE